MSLRKVYACKINVGGSNTEANGSQIKIKVKMGKNKRKSNSKSRSSNSNSKIGRKTKPTPRKENGINEEKELLLGKFCKNRKRHVKCVLLKCENAK